MLLEQVAEAAARENIMILGLILREDSVERFSNTNLPPDKFYECLMESAQPFRKEYADA